MTQSLIHDLKSPLQSLQIFSKNIQVRSAEDAFLFQAMDRLKKLIQDLAHKNRPQTALLEGIRISSLDELICEFEHRDFKVSWVRKSTEMSRIALDGRLVRLFQNLFENSVEAGASRIHIEVKQRQDQLFLQVSDNGQGVPSEVADQLGKKPMQSQKYQGSGQGLFLLCEELRCHQIDVRFFSEIDQGMMVQIKVPQSYLSAYLATLFEIQA
jgi:signal transduction histidine kinase